MKQPVIFRDLGELDYKSAWEYQENLLQSNIKVKIELRNQVSGNGDLNSSQNSAGFTEDHPGSGLKTLKTTNYLLFVEHPPVITLGKSGDINHILLTEEGLKEKGIEFFRTNRGGDITFHGGNQLVAYPIFDLEKFDTDIGHYLRNLEEVVILTLADYGINAGRSKGETGVWIEPEIKGKERKICAIGIRCSRWITMHGFAFNVNTDLTYFNYIIPCGIQNKQVTSLQKELGREIDIEDVKEKVKKNFERVFHVELTSQVGEPLLHELR